jgi:hypothetical protein
VIQQAAWCGDQDIDTFLQCGCLRRHRVTADGNRRGDIRVFAIALQIFQNLRSQFACRGQHQCARHARLGFAGAHDLEHRQGKGSGFACTCLCNAHDIAAHQHVRNGFFLNGGGMRVTDIGQRLSASSG